MPVVSVGDMAQQFVSMRNGGAIKTELSRLTESLSTGKVTDITQHLDGQTTWFSGINYTLTQLDGYGQAASETQQTLANMQTVLSQVDGLRGETGAQLLLVSDASTNRQIDEAAQAARGAFGSMVSALNTRLADRALFGGINVDDPPLADADAMLADLVTSIGGATTAPDIQAAVDTWFDSPTGGFATFAYQGDAGAALDKRVAENRSFAIEARADNAEIRDVLKAAAMAAMATDVPGLDGETRSALLQGAGIGLFAAADGLVAVQSRLGYVEAEVERTTAEMNAQRTALEISRNDLIAADQFDTASRLQSVQLQLETHYSVTARLSQISLLDYI